MTTKNTRRGETQQDVNKNIWVGQALPDNTPLEGHYCLNGRNNPYCQVEPDLHKQYRGFTLIELLVVVLIIGILAAVAVPQYQKAVAKSRVSTMLVLGKAIAQAQEVYYLNNDSYTKDIEKLDIELPNSCVPLTELEDEQHTWFACGKNFVFDNDVRGSMRINYCPGFNTSVVLCEQNRDLQILFHLTNATIEQGMPVGVFCQTFQSDLGQRICSSLGTPTENERYFKL